MADNKAYIEKKVIEVADPNMESAHVKFFTRSNPYWLNDPDQIRLFCMYKRNYLNDLVRVDPFVTLNEACKEFGFDVTTEGLIYGWTSDSYVDIDIREVYLWNEKERTYEMAYAIEFKDDELLLAFKK